MGFDSSALLLGSFVLLEMLQKTSPIAVIDPIVRAAIDNRRVIVGVGQCLQRSPMCSWVRL